MVGTHRLIPGSSSKQEPSLASSQDSPLYAEMVMQILGRNVMMEIQKVMTDALRRVLTSAEMGKSMISRSAMMATPLMATDAHQHVLMKLLAHQSLQVRARLLIRRLLSIETPL